MSKTTSMQRCGSLLAGAVQRVTPGWRRPWAIPAMSLVLAGVACDDDTTAPPQNSAPRAVVSVAPTTVPEGDANQTVVILDGSASSDPDGDPITFLWAATDGTFVEGTSSNSEIARVTFPGTAPYAVTLTVTDPSGATDQASTTVGLGEPPPPPNSPPVAIITANPISVNRGDNHQTTVTIDAAGSTDPDDDPLTFEWTVQNGNFVGGTTNEDPTIQVTFPGEAPYTVTVTVRDGRGGEDTAETVIGVVG